MHGLKNSADKKIYRPYKKIFNWVFQNFHFCGLRIFVPPLDFTSEHPYHPHNICYSSLLNSKGKWILKKCQGLCRCIMSRDGSSSISRCSTQCGWNCFTITPLMSRLQCIISHGMARCYLCLSISIIAGIKFKCIIIIWLNLAFIIKLIF